ncbi:MAG: hypothetical protein K6B15_10375 [Parasporobacterium sp.]|nr:hypothetical protein [Parasporobacterium sp.]
MLFLLFMIALVCFGWKFLVFAIHATWGIAKILLFLVFFPIILIGLVIGGLIYIALPVLLIVGIIGLLCGE